MKKFSLIFLAVCLLLTLAFPAFALTEENKVFVKVDGKGEDSVGGVLIYQVKELIRDSKKFTLVDLADDSKDKVFVIKILTLDGNGSGNSTIYNVNWLCKFKEAPIYLYLNNIVGICGSNRAKEVAGEIVATTDEIIEECSK